MTLRKKILENLTTKKTGLYVGYTLKKRRGSTNKRSNVDFFFSSKIRTFPFHVCQRVFLVLKCFTRLCFTVYKAPKSNTSLKRMFNEPGQGPKKKKRKLKAKPVEKPDTKKQYQCLGLKSALKSMDPVQCFCCGLTIRNAKFLILHNVHHLSTQNEENIVAKQVSLHASHKDKQGKYPSCMFCLSSDGKCKLE